ncbi:hypothetical protein Ct61P_05711 [Colletotrichum tofieldiae]|nr:hypothetical protein Ct61P_05711 [Colletotrichum tofieldiae]
MSANETHEAAPPQNKPMRALGIVSWDLAIETVTATINKKRGFSYFKVTGPSAPGNVKVLAAQIAINTAEADMFPFIIVPTELEFGSLPLRPELCLTWKRLYCDSAAREACLQKLRASGTLIVKLDDQRTVSSDFVQFSISNFTSTQLKEDKAGPSTWSSWPHSRSRPIIFSYLGDPESQNETVERNFEAIEDGALKSVEINTQQLIQRRAAVQEQTGMLEGLHSLLKKWQMAVDE